MAETANPTTAASRPLVVLRADAGGTTGFGHLVRSCALAAYLRSDFDCRIAGRLDSPEAVPFAMSIIEESGAEPWSLPPGCAPARKDYDRAFADSLTGREIVVLDNYFHSYEYQAEIRRGSRALVSVHDMPGFRTPADVLLTSSPLEREDFRPDAHTRFYGGIERAMLRAPFLAPTSRAESDSIRRVAICMGGADPLRLIPKMVEVTHRVLPDVEIDVIAGPTASYRPAPDARVTLHRNLPAERIAEIYDRCDLCICPASTSCYEAMARRAPVAVGFFVDNQNIIYDYLSRGAAYDMGDLRDSPDVLAQRLQDIADSYPRSMAEEVDFRRSARDTLNIFKELCSR